MSETATPCPRCGAPRAPGDSPLGLCPRCVLAGSLELGAPSAPADPAPRGEPPPAPSVDELAPHLPQLEIERLLARGGMGAVYLAKQRGLARPVALKVLDRAIADRPGFAERFEREARALARLTHPNIVAVHELGTSGPFSWIVMELVDGASLRSLISARSLAPREALGIVLQLCDALQFAHDQGVVHRDIKPENVLVDRHGRVKVLDFGLAKVLGGDGAPRTRATQVMGTPHYMAPEQWERPGDVDHRADIFALGVVFYELLTGELPLGRFPAPSRRVALDVRLDGVVLRALEKEPELRYQQAGEVRGDVERITRTPEAGARAAGEESPAPRTSRPAAPVRTAAMRATARDRGPRPWPRRIRSARAALASFLTGVPGPVRFLIALHAVAAATTVVALVCWLVWYLSVLP